MLRTPVSLKNWLAAHAKERGLSVNAAAIVLLDRQLAKAGYPPDSLNETGETPPNS